MPVNTSPLSTPLSDDEYERLDYFLDRHSPFDTNGLLGLLHAVAIAPSLVPPSAWIRLVLRHGLGGLDAEGANAFPGLLARLYNDVARGLNDRSMLMPDEDDDAGCDSFAAGYVAGVESDPAWVGDDGHRTFASWAAYLSGRHDLVPAHTLAAFAEDPFGARRALYRDMGGFILAAHDAFRVRRVALGRTLRTSSLRTRRAGRTDPCPCDSGKRYKRCCMDRGATLMC